MILVYNKININMEIIKKNINLPWDWSIISYYMSIVDIIKYHNKNLDWNLISKNQNITLEHIKKYPKLSWNWYMKYILSMNG